MARKKREKSSTGVYHVMLRGINKQNIFFSEDDYVKMQYILHDCQYVVHKDGRIISDNVCTIYAYCILNNHLHILLQEGEREISDIMKRIEDRYAVYYNQKYDRIGHLFQGRFPSEPVEDKDYFHRLLRYIHRNPVKAMEAKTAGEYPYSSWNEYTGDSSNIIKVLKPQAISAVFRRYPIKELTEWVNTDVNDNCLDMDNFKVIISDQEAFEILADISNLNNPEDFRMLDAPTQINYLLQSIDNGVSLRQASRLGTITYTQIRDAYKHKEDIFASSIEATDTPIDINHLQDRITLIDGMGVKTRHKLHMIVEFLYAHPNSDRQTIAAHLDTNEENTRRLLVRLLNEEIITSFKDGYRQKYVLKSVAKSNQGV